MARDIFQTTIVRRHPDSGLLEPLDDVDVFLFAPGSADPASAQMFQSGDSGNNAQYANPITTGANGLVEFYANVGEYDIRYEDPLGRIAPRTFRWNALPAAPNSIPNNVLAAIDKGALAALVQQMLWDVGEIKPVGYNIDAGSEPDGWLVCKGQAVSRATYAALFAKIGIVWGAGDGATTFNVPDLQGRLPMGAGSGAGLTARAVGAKAGAETVAITTAQMPSHTHEPNADRNTAGTYWTTDPSEDDGGLKWNIAFGGGSTIAFSQNKHQPSGSGQAHPNVPPIAVVSFLIKT